MLSAECRDVFRFGRYTVGTDRRILCFVLRLVQQLYLDSIATKLDCTVASYGVCVCVCVCVCVRERERERESF